MVPQVKGVEPGSTIPLDWMIARELNSMVYVVEKRILKLIVMSLALVWAIDAANAANASSDPQSSVDELPLCADMGTPQRVPASACRLRDATLSYLQEAFHSGWVELRTAKESERVFVTFPGEVNPLATTKTLRFQLRTDTRQDSIEQIKKTQGIDWPSTRVETFDLDCWRGEAAKLSVAIYDAHGKLLVSKPVDAPERERILAFYRSPLGEICRRDYIFDLLENGEEYLLALKRHERATARALLPGRKIPVSVK